MSGGRGPEPPRAPETAAGSATKPAFRARRRVHRRELLAWLRKALLGLSALMGLEVLARFLGYQPDQPPSAQLDAGPAASYPLGSRTDLPQAQAVLWHTEAGFVALSLVCPHLGCQVQAAGEGFECPCHGSRFDAKGDLKHGPADRPLSRLRTEVTAEGRLIVYVG